MQLDPLKVPTLRRHVCQRTSVQTCSDTDASASFRELIDLPHLPVIDDLRPEDDLGTDRRARTCAPAHRGSAWRRDRPLSQDAPM